MLDVDPLQKRINDITERLIGCGISVHRVLGPGLLESAYEECICFELNEAGLKFERQVPLPVIYKGVKLDCGYRMDIVIENLVIAEIKAVERLLPIHDAQLLSYLRLYDKRVGLLMNFHAVVLKNGLKRIANNF